MAVISFPIATYSQGGITMKRHLNQHTAVFVILALLVIMHLGLPDVNHAGNLNPSLPPTTGTMHTLDDIYSTVSANAATTSAKFVSGYAVSDGSTGTWTLLTVPTDKTFIMTDCIGNVGANKELSIQEK